MRESSTPAGAAAPSVCSLAIGRLRAFVTLLVVAHHAVLAYHPYAPPAPATLVAEPRWWPAFPVVDAQRFDGFGLFVLFNDRSWRAASSSRARPPRSR